MVSCGSEGEWPFVSSNFPRSVFIFSLGSNSLLPPAPARSHKKEWAMRICSVQLLLVSTVCIVKVDGGREQKRPASVMMQLQAWWQVDGPTFWSVGCEHTPLKFHQVNVFANWAAIFETETD